ncbi:uncharacterized protein LOC123670712 isoform X1 [Harmonia axyridis]|uniref:uncharacterized protein LOC123670712 isoform X1 n=1 Tax=Harmonia axyridis TaxID=115357 RepID=UPI001E2787D1|nr:uncharacterized protein LOC123670712 isoform X1 [Harmonia axyridis]
MCVSDFGSMILRTIFVLAVVQYVMCEKNGFGADFGGKNDTEISVENMLDDFVSDLGNSTFGEIMNFWDDEEDERESKSLEESTKNSTTKIESKSAKKDIKFGSGNGGGHGGSLGGQKKRKTQKKQQSLVQRIMPIMFIPFMISTAIIPLMIFVIKMLFIKAAIVAKVAVTLGIISFFKRRTNGGGVYNHNAWKM